MRHYETIYIINPNLADEDYKEIINKFSSLTEKHGGIIIKIEEWGNQRLAYLMKKFDKGHYVLMEYCGEPGITAELGRGLKFDDKILKYQTVKLADKADPQELILKEKEARKESAIKEDDGLQKDATVQNEEIKPVREVKNGV